MGIRGLLGFLLRNLGQKITPIKVAERKFNIARLYIDFQQLVYKALYELQNPSDVELIEKTTVKLLQVIKDFSPTDFLGIYFDGIPPLAKIVEQRTRRYEMKFAPGEFNNAKISVGTSFMSQLARQVIDVVMRNIDWLPPEIVISTIAEAGEGEHKMFNRIRDHDLNKSGVKVIVSDDTDSSVMAIFNGLKNTYVFIDHIVGTGLVDIELITNLLQTKLNRQPTAITDFVLMVLLSGGNDFIPWLQAGRMRTDIMVLFVDVYMQNNLPLTQNGGKDIIWENVWKLMRALSMNEGRLIKKLIEYNKTNGQLMDKISLNSIDPRTGVFNYEMFKEAWNTEIYRLRALPPTSFGKPSRKDIEMDHEYMAREYLTGVKWTYNYMLTGSGPSWYYKPSVLPPLLIDLANVLRNGIDPSPKLLQMPLWKPLDLSVYLLLILPERSAKDLIDIKLNKAFALNSGLLDLFPTKFEIFGPGEHRPGAAKAILPPLGIERIEKWVNENISAGSIQSNLQGIETSYKYLRKMGRWYKGTTEKRVTVSAPAVVKVGENYEICDQIIPDI